MVENLLHVTSEVSLFLFAAFAGYFIANWLKQPTAVVNIIIGIIIGPTFLHLVKYDSTVATLAHIGAIFHLFVVGLQFKGHHIYTNRNILVALGGMVVPWVSGYFIGKIFLGSVQAIFVATCLTATSIAVSVNLLHDMKLIKRKFAQVIIAAALIDDILGLLALSITQSFVTADNALSAFVGKAVLATIFLTFAILLGPYISKLTIRVHAWAKKRKVHHLTYLFAVMIAFFYGTLSEFVGLSAVVGAFLAGFALEHLNYQDFKIGAQYMNIVFSSILFMSLGILVKLHFNPKSILLVLTLIGIAITSKLFGSAFFAFITGSDEHDALTIGAAMTPRGEVAMITALIGLNIGVLTHELYSALIIMCIATCLFAPTLIKLTAKYRHKHITQVTQEAP